MNCLVCAAYSDAACNSHNLKVCKETQRSVLYWQARWIFTMVKDSLFSEGGEWGRYIEEKL